MFDLFVFDIVFVLKCKSENGNGLSQPFSTLVMIASFRLCFNRFVFAYVVQIQFVMCCNESQNLELVMVVLHLACLLQEKALCILSLK